jgi:hypothetical protein
MSKTYIPTALRELVAEQARYRCGYCLTQETVVGTPMVIDHLIPESRGGRTEESNLWSACTLCNGHKANRVTALDPQTGEGVLLFDPRRQAWREHFVWSTDGERIIGLTPIGRATVSALELNRPSLVTARRLWVSVGWHPPEDTRD